MKAIGILTGLGIGFLYLQQRLNVAPIKTKTCCNCGITYVVNHKSYFTRPENVNFHCCSKRCMFELENYGKRITAENLQDSLLSYAKRQKGTYSLIEGFIECSCGWIGNIKHGHKCKI